MRVSLARPDVSADADDDALDGVESDEDAEDSSDSEGVPSAAALDKVPKKKKIVAF